MLVTVCHVNEESFREICGSVNYVKSASENLDKYNKVAKVGPFEGTLTSILNQAYKASNSVESAWFLNDNVYLYTEGSRHRSTCCGDIFIINGDKYVVDSVGFTYID